MNNGDNNGLNLPARHPPLKRTGIGHEMSTMNHQMVFLTNSAPSYTPTSSLSMPIIEPSPDSCYSSCSEIGSHPSLSREQSDSLTNAFATQCSTTDHIEFAKKLGYSAENIQIVLQNIGHNAGQDEVLSELIKLGKNNNRNVKQVNHNQASRSKSTQWSTANTPTVILSSDLMTKKDLQPRFRPIVIDGPNLAMHHGRKEFFSCQGIRECVNFFVNRGHHEIYVFVPQYRREQPRADSPVFDQHILFELESEQRLIWTPSRRVNGKRIVCHDDRYILKTAYEKEDAIIVSNDEYRDLLREHPEYKQMVAQRLLMYSFVDGKFMPPDDPLGKRGPKLDRFLQTGPPFTMQACPYKNKCTYGNKCKFYHPERLNNVHVSTTERLLNKSDHKKQSLSARPSMVYEQRLDSMDQNTKLNALQHDKLTRAQSLNIPQNQRVDNLVNNQQHFNQFANQSNHLLQPNQQHFNPTIGNPTAGNHQLLNRHISAPPNNQLQIPGYSNDQLNNGFGSSSTTTLNQSNEDMFQSSFTSNSQLQMFAPSKSIWGHSEFSLSHIVPNNLTNNQSNSSTQSFQETRQRICFNLSQIFSESSVIAVLNAHPDELDPQKLCQRLLAFQSGFNS